MQKPYPLERVLEILDAFQPYRIKADGRIRYEEPLREFATALGVEANNHETEKNDPDVPDLHHEPGTEIDLVHYHFTSKGALTATEEFRTLLENLWEDGHEPPVRIYANFNDSQTGRPAGEILSFEATGTPRPARLLLYNSERREGAWWPRLTYACSKDLDKLSHAYIAHTSVLGRVAAMFGKRRF